MLRTTSLTGSSTILQSLIDAVDENEVGESGGNEINLSNPSALKKSTSADYLNSEGAKKGANNSKRGGGNIKKGVKAGKSLDYLTLHAKKTFNYLWHEFT